MRLSMRGLALVVGSVTSMDTPPHDFTSKQPREQRIHHAESRLHLRLPNEPAGLYSSWQISAGPVDRPNHKKA